MRWFKHLSVARNDEKIAELEDKAGLEGYGFYFKLLEIVAELMDHTDKCDATFSVSRWARQLNITTKKFIFLCQCCVDVGLISVQRQADVAPISSQKITVKIPNLLKFKDEYSKKSGQSKDNIRPKNIDTETDIDNKKEKINKKEKSGPDKPAEKRKAPSLKTPLPDGFAVSERVRAWAAKNGHNQLDKHLAHFVLVVKSNGYKYIDWDAAFMRAIGDDWARLNGKKGPPGKISSVFSQDFSKKDYGVSGKL